MENSGTVKERQYLIHLNSDEFEKAPAVSGINFGEIAVNYCSASPAIYIKVQSGDTSASQYTVAFRDVDWIMNHFSGGSPDVSELIRKINELSGSTVSLYDYVDSVSGDVDDYHDEFVDFSGYVIENYATSASTYAAIEAITGFSGGVTEERLAEVSGSIVDYVDIVSGDIESTIHDLSASTVGIQSGYVKTVCFSDSGAGQSNIGLDRTESSSDGATYTFDFSKIEINCGSF